MLHIGPINSIKLVIDYYSAWFNVFIDWNQDFVFDNAVGTVGVVETDFGFHVIKVLAKYDAVQLATITKKIEPSEQTIDDNYTTASKFESNATAKNFEEVAKTDKLTIVT